MSDRFHPTSMEQLTNWVFDELENKDALFGVPQSAFSCRAPTIATGHESTGSSSTHGSASRPDQRHKWRRTSSCRGWWAPDFLN